MVLVMGHPRKNEAAMINLFATLSTLTRRKNRQETPLDSDMAARNWLKSLPEEFDYDTHHALVQGLKRFHAEKAVGNVERLKTLMAIEEAGLPLQSRIVEQYMRNHAAFPLAKQALWRESCVFWSQLAGAWFNLLKQAYKGPARLELWSWRAEITTRALRYASLEMRWGYHNLQPPCEAAWRRVHNIYRMAERDGYADLPVMLNARQTTSAREYSLTVLIGMTNPFGLKVSEIEAIAQLFESFPGLPLAESGFEPGRHTHAVDLSVNEGAFVLDDNEPPGKQLRFFALTPLVDQLKSIEPPSSSGKAESIYGQIAKLIACNDVRRGSQRAYRFARVWVASGMGNILASLDCENGGRPRQAMETWMLRDESSEGMGFGLEASTALPHGRLIAVSRNPAENIWQLLAIRWNQEAEGQLLVGAQRLSYHPKRVEISFDPDTAGAAKAPTHAVFLPVSDTEADLSNLLLPQTHYQSGEQLTFRDGDMLYRIRLGQVYESHERWVRVGIDMLGREQIAAAA
jgi:hypothetical protein